MTKRFHLTHVKTKLRFSNVSFNSEELIFSITGMASWEFQPKQADEIYIFLLIDRNDKDKNSFLVFLSVGRKLLLNVLQCRQRS